MRASHSLNEETSLADFEVPFTDPLIDDIFIEANVKAVPFNSLILNSEIYTVTGDFGIATLIMAVHIRCALNYSGDNCEMLCDSDGNNCNTGTKTSYIRITDYFLCYIRIHALINTINTPVLTPPTPTPNPTTELRTAIRTESTTELTTSSEAISYTLIIHVFNQLPQ